MTNKSKPSPPTPEQIAEVNASAGAQLTDDIVKLVNACKIDDPPAIARVLCHVLIQFIMYMDSIDGKETTLPEAGEIAIRILKTIIKHTRYYVGEDNEVIDLRTNQKISPGGFKQ
jgi:hypothetical protein